MLILSIIFPLAATLIIETGLYMILKHRDLKLFLVVGMMNAILNPTMNLLIIHFGDTQFKYWLILSIGEVLTTLIESLIVFLFMRFKYLKILLFAFIANLASFLIGFLFEPVYDNKTLLVILTIVFLLIYLIIYIFVLISFLRKNTQGEN